jgi:hypothetical protein
VNGRVLSLFLILPLAACGSGSSDKGGTGGTGTGSGATGGTTGGSTGTTGGTNATGGTTGGTGTGGSTGTTGGSTSTGGKGGGSAGLPGSTGGSTGTTGGSGGTNPGNGGSNATGGTTGGSAGTTGGSTATGGGAGMGMGGTSPAAGAGGTGPSDFQGVLQHHGDAPRDGLYIEPAFTADAAKNLAVDSSFAGTFTADNVYAQPLYLVGAGGKPDQVYVFTDGNKVYAFDAGTGMQTWTKSFGTAVSGNPCGMFSDNGGMGITGTPVIDPASRTIYFAQATGGSATAHSVHAINADTGAELMGWPVAVTGAAKSGGTTFDSTSQKQRAALALLNGTVYVPFGGHVGDCGNYHGWVVGIGTADQKISAWATRAVGGAVWGASGLASDGTSLFFATGNSKKSASDGPNSSSGDSGGMWGDSETVYKFPASLTPPATSATTDFFLPMNWVALDDADQDMGGTSPILMDVPGATPSKLIVSLGKDGNAYLLDRTNLGGMDATPIVKLKVSGSQIINAMAGYHTAMGSYVVFKGGGSGCPSGQSGGLTAFKINAASPPTLSMAWCGGPSSAGSPSVTSTDASGANTIVWAMGSGTDHKLHGVDGDTGKAIVDTATLGTVQTIQTPIVAKGRIFVAGNSQVYALKP